MVHCCTRSAACTGILPQTNVAETMAAATTTADGGAGGGVGAGGAAGGGVVTHQAMPLLEEQEAVRLSLQILVKEGVRCPGMAQ